MTGQTESLAWSIDFKHKIEEARMRLKGEFAKPKHVGFIIDNVASVILTGGSTRTPMTQAAVKADVSEDRFALDLNAEEAAVLGAASPGNSRRRTSKLPTSQVSYFAARNQFKHPPAAHWIIGCPASKSD